MLFLPDLILTLAVDCLLKNTTYQRGPALAERAQYSLCSLPNARILFFDYTLGENSQKKLKFCWNMNYPGLNYVKNFCSLILTFVMINVLNKKIYGNGVLFGALSVTNMM